MCGHLYGCVSMLMCVWKCPFLSVHVHVGTSVDAYMHAHIHTHTHTHTHIHIHVCMEALYIPVPLNEIHILAQYYKE